MEGSYVFRSAFNSINIISTHLQMFDKACIHKLYIVTEHRYGNDLSLYEIANNKLSRKSLLISILNHNGEYLY